jgi:hypothetical protein
MQDYPFENHIVIKEANEIHLKIVEILENQSSK